MRDWARWHDAYDDPASALSTRLALVQAHLSIALAMTPAGPIRLVSLCAGQGRDVIGVLPGHPRRDDVSALLVENDPRNAGLARDRAVAAGLANFTVQQADAGIAANYAEALPADVLLLCGIFGNLSDEDILRTAGAAAVMCAAGGTVIWTRNRRPPDLTGEIRSWFAAAGFDEVAFDAPPTASMTGVGVHQLPAAVSAQLPAAVSAQLPAAVSAQLPAAVSAQLPAAVSAQLPAGRLFTFRPDGWQPSTGSDQV